METRFDQQEFKNACLIINTADYCQATAEEVRLLSPGTASPLTPLPVSSSRRRSRRRSTRSSRNRSLSSSSATSSSGTRPSRCLSIPSAHADGTRSVISAAITLQLRALEHALDGPLGALARTQWPAQRQVSGPAPYVGDLVRAVESVVELARPAVEGKKYLRNWLDKASG